VKPQFLGNSGCATGRLSYVGTTNFSTFMMRSAVPLLAACSLGVAACRSSHVGAAAVTSALHAALYLSAALLAGAALLSAVTLRQRRPGADRD
jgi:hypothetical protein